MKCGRSYPDGSPQILKGCEGCKGTRFFYTQKPVGEKERQELAERTQDDLGSGGGKGPGPERRIPTKQELPVGEDRDWVSMGPGNLRSIVEDVVRRAHEKKPTFRVAQAPEEDEQGTPSLQDWVRKRQAETSDDERPDDEGSSTPREPRATEERTDWPPWPSAGGKPESAPAHEVDEEPGRCAEPEDVVYRRSRRLARQRSARPGRAEPTDPLGPTSADGLGAEDEAGLPSTLRPLKDEPFEEEAQEEASPESEGGRPETVEVLEQGVYDLDVRRLLEKNPIVVYKDGSYSLHLPSLMESLDKKRR